MGSAIDQTTSTHHDLKKRISYDLGFQKKWFPILFSCVTALLTFSLVLVWTSNASEGAWWGFPLALVAAPVAGFLAKKFAQYAHRSAYVDEVYDCGDHIEVFNEGQQAHIPFAEIGSVTWTLMQPAHICLHLKRRSSLGGRIRFLPKVGFFSYSRVAKELRERSVSARRDMPSH